MPSKLIKLGWSACERGNTMLVQEDGPNMVAWLTVEGDTRLEVEYSPDNYPALNVRLCSLTDRELSVHITDNLLPNGWTVQKWNLSIPQPITREDQIFQTAVEGLQEYYLSLTDRKLVAKIKKKVTVPDTGNDQADYETTRDAIEKIANETPSE
jgi:hypothetical protein